MKLRLIKKLVGVFIALLISIYPISVFAISNIECTQTENEYNENVFSDRVAPISEEYLDYLENPDDYDGDVPSMTDLSYLAESYANSSISDSVSLPESYDLRDYGRVPSVKDQDVYGTCWTFAALDSAASGIISQFPTISFSNSHLSWFTYMGYIESKMLGEYFIGDMVSPFNCGGSNQTAVGTMAAWKGPVLSEKLPYGVISEYNEDLSSFESMRYDADSHLQDAFYLSSGLYDYKTQFSNINIVKNILMEYGCVSIEYNSSDEYYNYVTNAQYCPDPKVYNHAVLIVGWDDNYSRENFKLAYSSEIDGAVGAYANFYNADSDSDGFPENDGAWLIKNSWGTDNNDVGYFWLSYEDATIKYGCFYQLEAADNYSTNYQYDITGWTISVAADSADDYYSEETANCEGYAANIFTAESDEQLEAVSFYTTDADTQYQISVYTGSSEENPTSGELVYVGETSYEPYAGYHTIELDSAVKLQESTTFAVVVKFSNPNYGYPIAVNSGYTSLENLNFGSESFVSSDGENWIDISEYSDGSMFFNSVCIKAFTNPLPSDGEAVSNIRFSLLEGPVALGTELTLEGAQTINYQIDGGEIQIYSDAIIIDKPCTITAWGVENNKSGNKVTRTYTQAAAQLNGDLAVKHKDIDGAYKSNLEINSDNTAEIIVYDSIETIALCPHSTDTIKINGVEIASDDWSEEFSLAEGQKSKEIEIEVTGEGKTSTNYTIKLVNNTIFTDLSFDYDAEIIEFDEALYVLYDKNGNEIYSGDSVSDYSVLDDGANEQEAFLVEDKESGEFIGYVTVPVRQLSPKTDVDYSNECTVESYNNCNVWSSSSDDFTEVHICTGEPIKLDAGLTYHIWRPGDINYGFASEVEVVEIPERSSAPDTEVDYIDADYVKLKEIEGCEYRIADGEWQESPEFYDLNINTKYTFEVRFAAEEDSYDGSKGQYASEVSCVTVATLDGIIVPVSINYHGKVFETGTYALHVGKNEIYIRDKFFMEGFVPSDGQDEIITINVSSEDGKLVADKDFCVNIEMTEYDYDGNKVLVNAEDYKYTVIYCDADDLTHIIDKQVLSFVAPYELDYNDILIPDGYELVGTQSENSAMPALYFYNGVWKTYNNTISIAVSKVEESSFEPTEITEPTIITEPTTEQIEQTEPMTDSVESVPVTTVPIQSETTEISGTENPSDTLSPTSACSVASNAKGSEASTLSNASLSASQQPPDTGENNSLLSMLSILIVSSGIVFLIYKRNRINQ